MTAPLLAVDGLVKHFVVKRSLLGQPQAVVHAVDGLSFDVGVGETLALVGESGCGKSTVGRLVLRLIEPTAGRVTFEGRDVFGLPSDQLRRFRSRAQLIFQDPYASLNPRMTVADMLGEPLVLHTSLSAADRKLRIRELLGLVGLRRDHVDRYPHEFSGGQRQRIAIARALAGEPKLIVCDEPVSALDVSIRSQVLNLLKDLQQRFGLAYIFISHDLAVVKHIAARIAVMYLGRIVETGPADACIRRAAPPLYSSPAIRHPGALGNGPAQAPAVAWRPAEPHRPAARLPPAHPVSPCHRDLPAHPSDANHRCHGTRRRLSRVAGYSTITRRSSA